MSDILQEAREALEYVTPGRVVQFHPWLCKEAEGAPFSEWDSSHDLSVIKPDGVRYRIGSMRHADDAAFFQWAREGVPALIARAEAAETALTAERAKVVRLVATAWPFSQPVIRNGAQVICDVTVEQVFDLRAAIESAKGESHE